MATQLEITLISCYKDEMVSFLNSHPEFFDEAFELAVSDKQPYAWRSAWLLWSCLKENDVRIKKHIDAIIKSIKSKNDGHQRELLKILSLTELKDKHEGIVFNLCMDLWEQLGKDPSVRYTALKFLLKIIGKHPELKEEISFITQEHYLETLSPGVKRAIIKMIGHPEEKCNLSGKKYFGKKKAKNNDDKVKSKRKLE